MKDLIKKILTDKRMRNVTMLSTFALTVTAAGQPWGGV